MRTANLPGSRMFLKWTNRTQVNQFVREDVESGWYSVSIVGDVWVGECFSHGSRRIVAESADLNTVLVACHEDLKRESACLN